MSSLIDYMTSKADMSSVIDKKDVKHKKSAFGGTKNALCLGELKILMNRGFIYILLITSKRILQAIHLICDRVSSLRRDSSVERAIKAHDTLIKRFGSRE